MDAREIAVEVLREKLEEFDERLEQCRQDLEVAQRRRDAAQEMINILVPQEPISVYGVTADELEGENLEDCLVHLATENDNVVDSTAVRPLLVEAGQLSDDKAVASQQLYGALSSSEFFEKLGRGKYRLRMRTKLDADDIPF